MRYDTPIYFQRILQGAYNAETGDYAPETVEETVRYASVMDTRTETMRLIYGDIREGSLTVHLPQPYRAPFDRIRVGERVFRADFKRDLRVKQSFVLSEVQT